MTIIAPILEQTINRIRFTVDNVDAAQEHLTVNNPKPRLEKFFEKPLLAFSHDDTFQLIRQRNQTHSLARAVHVAFSSHRPLRLNPDVIWITLAQGFAQHINNNAETLRSQFVGHQGKKKLVVKTSQIPSQAQHWNEAIQQWSLLIRDNAGDDLHRLLECNFSTTTPITRTVSHIVMMDAFQQYFEYELQCICGIPDITLEGRVEDWQRIYDRVQRMSQYELDWWTVRVLPICQEFINAASGQPRQEFWQAIYKPKEIYGGSSITGWLADLFPYLDNSSNDVPLVRNPILNTERVKLTIDNGISFNSLPCGFSEAPVQLKTQDGQMYSLGLVAGFIGVYQHGDGSLQPELGWAVREREAENKRLQTEIDRTTQSAIHYDPFDGLEELRPSWK